MQVGAATCLVCSVILSGPEQPGALRRRELRLLRRARLPEKNEYNQRKSRLLGSRLRRVCVLWVICHFFFMIGKATTRKRGKQSGRRSIMKWNKQRPVCFATSSRCLDPQTAPLICGAGGSGEALPLGVMGQQRIAGVSIGERQPAEGLELGRSGVLRVVQYSTWELVNDRS